MLSFISSDLEKVEKLIEENIHSSVELVNELSNCYLSRWNKNICSCVIILCAGTFGLNNDRKIIAAAASLELIRASLYLHEEILTDLNTNVEKTTANRITGRNQCLVLVGDLMLSKAFRLIQSCQNLHLVKIISDSVANNVEGQVVSTMISRNMINITDEVYFPMLKSKAASLIQCSGKVAALLSGAQFEIKSAMLNFAYYLGMACALVDCCLDYSDDEKNSVENLNQQLVNGSRIIFPLYYALQDASYAERILMIDLLGKDYLLQDELFLVLSLIKKYDGIAKARNESNKYFDNANRAIADLPNNDYKVCLYSLVNYIIELKVTNFKPPETGPL